MTTLEEIALPGGVAPEADIATSQVATSEHHSTHTVRKCVGALLLGAALGARFGFDIGINTPTSFDLIPGTRVSTELTNAPLSEANAGSFGDLNLPALHQKSWLLGDTGVEFTTGPLQFNGSDMGILTAAIAHPRTFPQTFFETPIEGHLKKHVEHDMEAGGAAGAVAALGLFGALLRRRNRQKVVQTARENNGLLAGSADPLIQQVSAVNDRLLGRAARRPLPRGVRRTGRGVAAVTAAAASIFALTYTPRIVHEATPPAQTDPVDPWLTEGIDFLQGASVTSNSPLEATLNTGLPELIDAKNQIDDFYSTVLPNISQAFDRWQQDPSNRLYFGDSNIVPVLLVSDLHCDINYSTALLPLIAKRFKPQFIINTGDTADSYPPIEPFCDGLEQYGIEAANAATHHQTMELVTAGDDDSSVASLTTQHRLAVTGSNGKPYHPVITFGAGHNTATIDGITVVSGQDPVRHITNEPRMINGKPASAAAQYQAQIQAGQSLSKTACAVMNHTGEAPIEISHVEPEAYPTLAVGCASAVISAEPAPGTTADKMYRYGATAILDVNSSGGVDWNGNTIYATIKHPAPTVLLFIQKGTNAVVGQTTLTVEPSGHVSLPNIAVPPSSVYPGSVKSFLKKYTPTKQQSAASPAVRKPTIK